ncbi:epoxide hydrolase N-terminal domain-containing protein [Micromonospora sp. NPDC005203]|uniref:epoxide hydrolase N-terminal domain-containing protein n=1 Tax=Micromonospora sp. NPDC005203 TaxID=3364226 RepID=UPI0036B37676
MRLVLPSSQDPTSVEPFRVHASPEELENLRARLRATRWPDAPEDAGGSPGTDITYLREIVDYWAEEFDWPAEEFDWPAQETALARLPRSRTPFGDMGGHLGPARRLPRGRRRHRPLIRGRQRGPGHRRALPR